MTKGAKIENTIDNHNHYVYGVIYGHKNMFANLQGNDDKLLDLCTVHMEIC